MTINRIRLYGERINSWKHEIVQKNGVVRNVTYQTEELYKEYGLNGELVGIGTEDFTPERYKNEIAKKYVCTWDGKSHDNGNRRKFECQGMIIYRKSEKKEVMEYLKNKYSEAEFIQLR